MIFRRLWFSLFRRRSCSFFGISINFKEISIYLNCISLISKVLSDNSWMSRSNIYVNFVSLNHSHNFVSFYVFTRLYKILLISGLLWLRYLRRYHILDNSYLLLTKDCIVPSEIESPIFGTWIIWSIGNFKNMVIYLQRIFEQGIKRRANCWGRGTLILMIIKLQTF